jgi:hypothetical protein
VAQEFQRDLDFDMPVEVASDTYSAMTRRLKTEIGERNALVQGILARANRDQRDLAADELEIFRECRRRLAEAHLRLLRIEEAIREVST